MASTATNVQTKKNKVLKPYSVRQSITPGTVLILLAGIHRGKRVVYLKQLKSGLLLVSGPFKINGVPLRRVNAAYVIATTTKLDIANVSVPEHIDDAYFAKPKSTVRGKITEKEFFGESETKKAEVSDERKADQKNIDNLLLPLVKSQDHLSNYLSTKFSLSKGQFPHELVF